MLYFPKKQSYIYPGNSSNSPSIKWTWDICTAPFLILCHHSPDPQLLDQGFGPQEFGHTICILVILPYYVCFEESFSFLFNALHVCLIFSIVPMEHNFFFHRHHITVPFGQMGHIDGQFSTES